MGKERDIGKILAVVGLPFGKAIQKVVYSVRMEEAKKLLWMGSSLSDLKTFPEDARRIAGHQLHLVQQGLEPLDWKAMTSIGRGVYEIRIRTSLEHRVFYVAKFTEGVYVLHAFQKKSQKTSRQDLERGRRRYQEVLEHHRHEKKAK